MMAVIDMSTMCRCLVKECICFFSPMDDDDEFVRHQRTKRAIATGCMIVDDAIFVRSVNERRDDDDSALCVYAVVCFPSKDDDNFFFVRSHIIIIIIGMCERTMKSGALEYPMMIASSRSARASMMKWWRMEETSKDKAVVEHLLWLADGRNK